MKKSKETATDDGNILGSFACFTPWLGNVDDLPCVSDGLVVPACLTDQFVTRNEFDLSDFDISDDESEVSDSEWTTFERSLKNGDGNFTLSNNNKNLKPSSMQEYMPNNWSVFLSRVERRKMEKEQMR